MLQPGNMRKTLDTATDIIPQLIASNNYRKRSKQNESCMKFQNQLNISSYIYQMHENAAYTWNLPSR